MKNIYEAHCFKCGVIIKFAIEESDYLDILSNIRHIGNNCNGTCLVCFED